MGQERLGAAPPEPHSRHADAPGNADWTIDQDWRSYSAQEHDRWNRLFERQAQVLADRACQAFLDARDRLGLSASGIPDFAALSRRLTALTGWRLAPVAGLIPDDVFFTHLAQRRFPAGAFIRPEAHFDYLEEPDVFHDVFGHAPLLADPVYARFMEACGRGGRRALASGQLHNFARLYWRTVEFGLIAAPEGLRIFGAGLLSSPAEAIFALEDASPHRLVFDLERVMRTKYRIDDFQPVYFVIDSFDRLRRDCDGDFAALYTRLRSAPDIAFDALVEGDRIFVRAR
jgi:phenylalanine-4-hydroxylase